MYGDNCEYVTEDKLAKFTHQSSKRDENGTPEINKYSFRH